MTVGVLLASFISDDDVAASLLSTADYLIAADGGAAHAKRLGLPLDLVTGDFDSLDEKTLSSYRTDGISIVQVPERKNETDAELAIRLAIKAARERSEEAPSLLVVGATGGRLDHELATVLHLASYAEKGLEIVVSDGVSALFFVKGPVKKSFVWPPLDHRANADLYVSSVALKGDVSGLSYAGLEYPLNDFRLPFGSTRGISNRAEDLRKASFEVSLEEGLLAVIVTPDRL